MPDIHCPDYLCTLAPMPTVAPDVWRCRKHGPFKVNTGSMNSVAEEVAERDRILEIHEERQPDTLEWLRAEMEDLFIRRARYDKMASVNANDAREVLQRKGYRTGPWMGALFRTENWERTGQTVASTAAGSHARILWCYQLKGYF